MRGDWRVQPSIPACLGKTALLLDVMHVFAAEFLDRRDDRADGSVAKSTERLAADVVGHVEEQIGILLAAFATLDAVEDRLHPIASLTARRALTARLMCEKLREPPDGIDDADRVIQDDDASRS